jgi:hypothetical protein
LQCTAAEGGKETLGLASGLGEESEDGSEYKEDGSEDEEDGLEYEEDGSEYEKDGSEYEESYALCVQKDGPRPERDASTSTATPAGATPIAPFLTSQVGLPKIFGKNSFSSAPIGG